MIRCLEVIAPAGLVEPIRCAHPSLRKPVEGQTTECRKLKPMRFHLPSDSTQLGRGSAGQWWGSRPPIPAAPEPETKMENSPQILLVLTSHVNDGRFNPAQREGLQSS